MSKRLRLDPIACDGHGLCAELLPEIIELDEWGFPILHDRDVAGDLDAHARRAVAACPALALRLERRRRDEASVGRHGGNRGRRRRDSRPPADAGRRSCRRLLHRPAGTSLDRQATRILVINVFRGAPAPSRFSR
jgi:ferredoxin